MLIVRRMSWQLPSLTRAFAKKTKRLVKTLEREEYDLETALKLLKAESVASKDESVDVLIK